MKTAISLLFVIILSGVCFAEAQNVYHNTQAHFSFAIPDGWQEIPKQEIDEYYKNIKLPAGLPSTVKITVPDAWFQKKGEEKFEPESPYLSLNIMEAKDFPGIQKAMQYEIKEYYKSKEYKALKEALKDKPNPTFLDYVRLSGFKTEATNERIYDPAKNIFIKTGASLRHFKDKGRSMFIVVETVYKGGTVNLSFHSNERDLQNDLAYFEAIMNSFKFDEGVGSESGGKKQ